MYSVPMPPEDLVAFGTLEPLMNSLTSIILTSENERDSQMDKFCSSLHEDIEQLSQKIVKTQEMAQVCEENIN